MPFPIPEDQLAATERAIGRRLPSAYRVKMLQKNGGELEIDGEFWFLFPLENRLSTKLISRTCNHALREARSAWESDVGFPMDAFPIAENGSGDYLVLMGATENPDTFKSRLCVWRLHGAVLEESKTVDEVFS